MYHGAIIRANKPTPQQQPNAEANEKVANEPNAQEVLEQANVEAENIRQKAMLEAKQERDIILEQAKIDSDKKIAAHILKLSQDFRSTVRQQEAKIGKVIATTIRQIISDIPPEDLQRDVLKTALRNFADESALSIRVAPESFDQTWWANWKWAMDNDFDVNTITKDPSLSQGRCILEFANHKVDIGIQTQLDSLEQLATGRAKNTTKENPSTEQTNPALIEQPSTTQEGE